MHAMQIRFSNISSAKIKSSLHSTLFSTWVTMNYRGYVINCSYSWVLWSQKLHLFRSLFTKGINIFILGTSPVTREMQIQITFSKTPFLISSETHEYDWKPSVCNFINSLLMIFSNNLFDRTWSFMINPVLYWTELNPWHFQVTACWLRDLYSLPFLMLSATIDVKYITVDMRACITMEMLLNVRQQAGKWVEKD